MAAAVGTTRRELVLMLTLNSLCDSYYNFGQTIASEVMKDGQECGVTIEKPEVAAALEELIKRGWAKAYWLHIDRTPKEFDHVPTIEEMEDFYGAWFDMTDAGVKVHQGWKFWPWDDDNQIRKDWTPPLN